jgi:four helix bundle protein
VIRSSGSVGANYIEANEALTKKEFRKAVKIALREARESRHWLRLLDTNDEEDLESERAVLIDESVQLVKILGAILRNMDDG